MQELKFKKKRKEKKKNIVAEKEQFDQGRCSEKREKR